MEPQIFRKFTQIVKERAGISLREGKETLLSARIGKRLRALQLDSPSAYLQYLERDKTGEEIVHFLDVVSTNYTHFMRERDHFELLGALAQKWKQQERSRIRVWSCACATGEEPYSIALVLLDAFEHSSVDIQILATDISTRVLDTAKQGVYTAQSLEPVQPRLVQRFFEPERTEPRGVAKFKAREILRKHVFFRRLNLAHPPFPMRGPFDVVFCRNVMIYFETKERAGLIGQAERLLAPGGLLFVGHAETLNGINTSLLRVAPSVYKKPSRSEHPAAGDF